MNKTGDTQVIPDIIRDSHSGTTYAKGKFYGKGGFAKCYEIIKLSTNESFAGKVISKKLLGKPDQRQKLVQEVSIHRSLKSKHVVQFYNFFDDSDFAFMVLELCRRRSMMELHKRRHALTEPEVRYFMKQILDGVQYLHSNNVIHRDLKLGNLFLTDELQVKIGDFGLATKVEFSGQRKRTLCGTPNYIAPEVLCKKGHSYEVDVWSLGCIMYTLLVGNPPFETKTLKETYAKIKSCEYSIPPSVNNLASQMIHKMLQPDPTQRPAIKFLLDMDFINIGYCPKELPLSCLTFAPRFDTLRESDVFARKPLSEINKRDEDKPRCSVITSNASGGNTPMGTVCYDYMRELYAKLKTLVKERKLTILPESETLLEEMSDPAAQPFVWITKWVDYSDRYGFGYELINDGVGVMFNDNTRVLLLSDLSNVHYIEKNGEESYYVMGRTPSELDKKIKLLEYFRRYMNDNLMKAGGNVMPKESDSLSRIPYLQMWSRSNSAVLMQLTNGTVQINFNDHSKLIMCPLMEAVTYIDVNRNFRTYRFSTIAKKGCVKELNIALQYAYEKLGRILENYPSVSTK